MKSETWTTDRWLKIVAGIFAIALWLFATGHIWAADVTWNYTVGLGGHADSVYVKLYRDFVLDSSFLQTNTDSAYFSWTENDSSYCYATFKVRYANETTYGSWWAESPQKWRCDGDSCYWKLEYFWQDTINRLIRRTWLDFAITATDTFTDVTELIDSVWFTDSTAAVLEYAAIYSGDTLDNGDTVIYGWTDTYRAAYPETTTVSTPDTVWMVAADTVGDTTNTTAVLFDLAKITGAPMASNAIISVRIYAVNDSLLRNDSGAVFAPYWVVDTTNSSGRVIMMLYPNAYFTNDSSFYKVEIVQKLWRHRALDFRMRVPDEDTTVSVQNLSRW